MFRKILLASLVAATASLIAPTATFAADTPPTSQPAERPHPLDRIRDLLEKLNLTAEEKTQIKTIMEDAREKIKPILEADKGDREKLRTDLAPVLKDTLKKIGDVLTEEQKKKLHELMEERRENRPGTATQK